MKDLDIKDIWKQSDQSDQAAFADSQIEDMIRKGSDGIIHRFIKTLTVELWINLIVLTALGFWLLFLKEWVVGSIVMLINLLFYLYYRVLIRNLRTEKIDSTVLEYLYTVQKMVKRFLIHYRLTAVILTPFVVAIVVYMDTNRFYDMYFSNPKSIVIGMICGLLLAVPVCFYFIHLMYGKKARKLALMIDSLEQEEG